MNLNVNKTKVISFCRQTNCHGFDYKLSEWSITRTDCIRDLGVLIDTNLHFHIFCQAVGLLGLIQSVTLRFSSPHSLLTTYCTLVRPQLQYASIAWNYITCSDVFKLGRVHRSRFFSHLDHSCGYVSNYLQYFKLLRCSEVLPICPFLTNVLNGSKYWPTLLETVGLRVPK